MPTESCSTAAPDDPTVKDFVTAFGGEIQVLVQVDDLPVDYQHVMILHSCWLSTGD